MKIALYAIVFAMSFSIPRVAISEDINSGALSGRDQLLAEKPELRNSFPTKGNIFMDILTHPTPTELSPGEFGARPDGSIGWGDGTPQDMIDASRPPAGAGTTSGPALDLREFVEAEK